MAEEKKKPKVQKKTVDKWKKKIWYSIYAPAEFEEKLLGETIAEKPQMVVGRGIVVSVRDLAGLPAKGHISMSFKVKGVKGNKAHTDVTGFNVGNSYLRRLIRRRMSKIEVVLNTQTKDNKNISVKAVTLTAKKATEPQRKGIHNAMKEKLDKLCKGKEYEKLITEFVFANTASKIFNVVKKIMPVKRVEITKVSLLKSK